MAKDVVDVGTTAAKIAARAEGWTIKDGHFTRNGVSISYINWDVLCREEHIAVPVTI